jgi:hypothetical protein
MDEPTIIEQIHNNRAEFDRRVQRIRRDTEASASEKQAALALEHRNASKRHTDLVAQLRTVAAATQAEDAPPQPQTMNDLIRQGRDAAFWGPANRRQWVGESLLVRPLERPSEVPTFPGQPPAA